GDGSLEGNRIVDAAGYDLEITLGGGEFEVSNAGNSNLYIREATGSDAELRGVNPAGDKDVARVFFSAQGGMADAYFDANYQDGTKLASIHAHAESGLTAFTYSADTHTFNVG